MVVIDYTIKIKGIFKLKFFYKNQRVFIYIFLFFFTLLHTRVTLFQYALCIMYIVKYNDNTNLNL